MGLIDIVDKIYFQNDMFSEGQTKRSDELMTLIDGVNKKFGKSTVYLAAEGMQKKWKMKQEHKSPCYTTVWQDLPRVKC